MHTLSCSILSIICTLSLFGAEERIVSPLEQFKDDFAQWHKLAQRPGNGSEFRIIADMMCGAGKELERNGGPITDPLQAHDIAMRIAQCAVQANNPSADDPEIYAQRIVEQATGSKTFCTMIMRTASACAAREKRVSVAIDLVICSSIVHVLKSGNPAGIYLTKTHLIHRRKGKEATAKAIKECYEEFFEEKIKPLTQRPDTAAIFSPNTIPRLREAMEKMDLAAWLIENTREDSTLLLRF